MEAPPPEDLLAQIQAAPFAGRKIEAIKLYREATGKRLAEAKDTVEAMETELRASAPERFQAPPQGKGCAGMVILLCFGLPGILFLLSRGWPVVALIAEWR